MAIIFEMYVLIVFVNIFNLYLVAKTHGVIALVNPDEFERPEKNVLQGPLVKEYCEKHSEGDYKKYFNTL